MIVAVVPMEMVEMPIHDIILVISVRGAFMPANRAVSVFAIVPLTFMVGRAAVRVGATYGNGVLIDVIVMDVMQVTVMEIVDMPVVAYQCMPTVRTVQVAVSGVRYAFGLLNFLHNSSFQIGNTNNQLAPTAV